ncbi:hypothetical protein Goklo_029790 [Gossypium klotzschianum]|uniref:F-box associated beta-propeller type 1 domain-containing protein n=1 Tax=Gossypium klotzschianum TaxID=34286 RepID=A0A7J8W6Y7_9ROSI|nr:hypothetical protein [Gossypium klotzschianum]
MMVTPSNLISLNFPTKKINVKQNIHLPFFKNAIPSVYGACHGLLSLREPSTNKAAIWNPSTREFKILPPSSVQCSPYFSSIQEGCLTLVDVSFSHAAFGFDSKTDDYKVILFVALTFINSEEEHHFESQVELYSFRSDSWKEIPSPDYTLTHLFLGNNYIDGICYWKTECLAFHDFIGPILSFDMANEKFSILSIPEFIGTFSKCYFNLLVFNGSLGVITYGWNGIGMSFDLWIRSEGVWTKQFSIESISGAVYPLGFGKNDEFFLRNTNNEVLLFDPSTQELNKLETNTYLDNFLYSISLIHVYVYVESLIRINRIQEPKEHIIRQPTGDVSNKC